MYQDKYLANCKKAYAIKIADLLGTKIDQNYLEYSYHQLGRRDLLKLLRLISSELNKELKNGRKNTNIVTTITRRTTMKTKNKFNEAWVENQIANLIESTNDSNQWARELSTIFTNFPHFHKLYMSKQKDILFQSINQRAPTTYQKAIKKFSDVFKLSSNEKAILNFLYLVSTDKEVEEFFTNSNIDMTNITKSLRYFCRFLEIKPNEIRDILSKDSVLMKAGIIKKHKRSDSLELSETVVSFLGGLNKHSIEADYVKKADLTETLALKDHNISDEKIKAIQNLLSTKDGCNIILYGHPGTGKTEFAKSLAKESSKKIYFINQSDIDGDESLSFRKQAIIAAHNIIRTEDAIIVVDECDKILNIYDGMWKCETDESNDRKAWINDFLEKAKHKIIWISNRVDGTDESTRRRFSYSLEFMPLSFSQRKKVWETQVLKQGIGFVDNEDILNLAKNLKVNSGGITLALKDVQGMKSLESKDQKLEVLKTILTQHQTFTSEEVAGLIKKTSKYNLEIVNSDYPLEKLLNYAAQFLKDRIAFNSKGVYNLNLLLQGPPGTGKTEFVKHLADITDRELVIKRASDIRSKWYGESVKNVAKCFKEAQEKGSILFFDEADSFFGSREGGNEYHAEETNELLTQMENFQGILVCATNFTQKIDQAAMRRFNYKVKFDYLGSSGKEELFQSYFSDNCLDGLDISQKERLDKISGLTPGDFKVVFQKNIFNKKRYAMEFLDELENEISYKYNFSKKVSLV